MGNSDDPDNTQPLDPQTETLCAMISSLIEEHLRPFREQIARVESSLAPVETEEDTKARYIDLRARLARMQESMDILNDKFTLRPVK